MAVNLSPVGGVAAQFFTSTGAVLTGGKLYTYAAGTTTPAVTYTTSQGNVPWTNPVVLDAAGRVPGSGEIWLTDGIIYKFVLKDSNDVLIATYDNITGINSNSVAYTNQQEIVTATAGQTVFNLGISYQPGTNSLSVFVDGVNQYGPGALYSYVETDSNTVTFNSGLHVGAEVKFTTTQQQGAGAVDASQVTYDPPFTGSVATNVEAKLAQTISVKDFGAVGDGVTDDADAIQAALDAVPAGGATIYFPSGNYKLGKGVNVLKDQTTLLGAGKFNTELSPLSTFDRATYDALVTIGDGTSTDVGANCVIQNLSVISTYNNDGDDVSGVCINSYYNTDLINCEMKGGNPDTRQTGGVHIKRGLHIRIVDCNMHNGYGYGALLSGGTDITFINCAFDETQAGIVTDNNVYRMSIQGCAFGALLNNGGYPATKTGSHIDFTTGAHDTLQILNCVFEGNTGNAYTNYGVNTDNVDTLIVQNCRFTDMRRMAVCKRSNKSMMIENNYFYNCGWASSTYDATLGTTNPDTTPFIPDIYSAGASTNATLIVGNRTATNVRVMAWLEGSTSGSVSSECNIIGNFASGGAAYVRGVYAYDYNNFVRGFTSPKSAPPITVTVAGFTIGANATTSGTFNYAYAATDSIILGSVQGGALNTALTFRVEPVSGSQCRWVVSNTTGSPITQAGFSITVSLIMNQ